MKNRSWSLIVLAVFVTQTFSQTPSQSNEPPAFEWSWEKIQSIVGKVRAGKDLTPRPWPGNNRVAVALSFDLDNETPALRDNNLSPSDLSQGEYGSRVALARILALLREHQIKASFFIPAVVAKLYPDSAKQIITHGHEIGIHGWIQDRKSTRLNSSHSQISYAVFCLKKKKKKT